MKRPISCVRLLEVDHVCCEELLQSLRVSMPAAVQETMTHKLGSQSRLELLRRRHINR